MSARQTHRTAQSVALTCDHSTASLTRRRFSSHTRIALDMDAWMDAYESKDRQGRRLGSIVRAPGRRRLYLATAHFSVITLQQKHTENVTGNGAPFQKRHDTQPDCSLSASRNSCLRLNLNINVETRALCFASKYGARAD